MNVNDSMIQSVARNARRRARIEFRQQILDVLVKYPQPDEAVCGIQVLLDIYDEDIDASRPDEGSDW